MKFFNVVLIVDDDEISQFLLLSRLKKHSFAKKYHTFESAREALLFLENHKDDSDELPDLIFLDINMPEMDSWEFLEKYQSITPSFSKSARVCILTSSVFEKDIKRAKSHSLVDEYLIKPIKEDSLQELLKRYSA